MELSGWMDLNVINFMFKYICRRIIVLPGKMLICSIDSSDAIPMLTICVRLCVWLLCRRTSCSGVCEGCVAMHCTRGDLDCSNVRTFSNEPGQINSRINLQLHKNVGYNWWQILMISIITSRAVRHTQAIATLHLKYVLLIYYNVGYLFNFDGKG